jgi:protein-disulfide isomerase
MNTDAHRKRRLAMLGGALLVAIVAVAVIIAVSSGGSSSTDTKTTSTSAAPAQPEFAGIPQKGNTLGNANAPATMVVFADLQCPFCAQFENGALPTIVRRYVRPGKLKIEFRPIAILGQDSILGARASAAAAQQNKMFDFNARLYRNQGEENSGYLNQAYVKKIATGVPGLDPAKLIADLKIAPVNKFLNETQGLATSGHVDSTPSFFVARSGQPLKRVQVTTLAPSAFYPSLDQATR